MHGVLEQLWSNAGKRHPRYRSAFPVRAGVRCTERLKVVSGATAIASATSSVWVGGSVSRFSVLRYREMESPWPEPDRTALVGCG